MEEVREVQTMSTEEMQRFLDWCSMQNMPERTAYDGLMYILGLVWNGSKEN